MERKGGQVWQAGVDAGRGAGAGGHSRQQDSFCSIATAAIPTVCHVSFGSPPGPCLRLPNMFMHVNSFIEMICVYHLPHRCPGSRWRPAAPT